MRLRFFQKHGVRQAVFAYAVLSPAIVYFLVYFFYPIAVELWASFFRGQPLIGEAQFAGFDNYIQALTDERVRDAFFRTMIFAISGTICTLVPALCLAAILSGPIKAATAIRAIIFFPYIISFVIVALMWKSILDPYTGMLNAALAYFGLPMQNWLSTPATALPTIIGVTVWKDIGYAMLIYIAAIQTIPSDLYEAADVDGATARQKFWRITVPLLTPTTLFLAVISMIAHLQDLSAPYLLTGGGPAEATRLYALHVYETAFVELNIGYASALSFLMLIVILIVTALQFRFLNRETSY
ncbi:sugar ABC transporter permease [Rhizobium cauense]|uniref:carbohydrate ABC transporter permease n=1 Tax=Rhizobium cauense TaxID=1166683 RepID=UPI001C6F1188|nr:sugar ABC transporter permease [Rhizobium cauense]MBW9115719.1 sugar ABC transporter permease [Rhizobium cauense]